MLPKLFSAQRWAKQMIDKKRKVWLYCKNKPIGLFVEN
jgi:hypothetical protein